MCGTGNEKKFFVRSTECLIEALFGHVERVSGTSGNHQQGDGDEFHTRRGIKAHQINQTAFGVAKSGIGMA